MLVTGCAQKNAPPPYAPEQSSTPSSVPPGPPAPARSPPRDLAGTATPGETLKELERPTITRLDFGLHRLREEYLPAMALRLRARGLAPVAATPGNARNGGVAAIKMLDVGFNAQEKLIEISVATADTGAAAATHSVSQLQALETRIIAEVRSSFGGACPGQSFDPASAGSCEPAMHFYHWFETTGVDGNSEPVIAHDRAAYNLYSLAQVIVEGNLVGSGGQKPVSVTCKAPLIRDEVKCTTSEQLPPEGR